MLKYKFFIGIDISKKWIDVCLTINGDKKLMPHLKVDNTEKGFKQMLQWITQQIQNLKKQDTYKDYDLHKIHLPKHWVFCMEHTGVYTFPLTQFLQNKNLDYVMVNPLHLKYSLGLRRGKNDQADAKDIARYIFLHQTEHQPTVLPSNKLLKIRHLLSLRRRLVKSRKGLTMAANELKSFTNSAQNKEVVRYSNQNLKQINKTILQIEKQIKFIISQDDQLDRLYQLVTSVKGVSIVIGASLLVYTVGFTAFESSRQFATYIGLSPFAHKSGSSLNIPAKVSHLAHKKLKGDISCGAANAMRYDHQLKAYYQRRLKEGKNKFVVQNAIRNKFIHRIFAVVKRGTPYVELDLHQS